MKTLAKLTVCLLVLAFGQGSKSWFTIDYDKYEDLRGIPKYRDVAGKIFELKCDFWVFGYVTSDDRGQVIDEHLKNHTMTAYDGPAIGGGSLRYFGRLPKDTRVRVTRIIELSSWNPVYWIEVINPLDERYTGLPIKIQQGSHVENYSRKKYSSGAHRLNDAFFKELAAE